MRTWELRTKLTFGMSSCTSSCGTEERRGVRVISFDVPRKPGLRFPTLVSINRNSFDNFYYESLPPPLFIHTKHGGQNNTEQLVVFPNDRMSLDGTNNEPSSLFRLESPDVLILTKPSLCSQEVS